MYNPQLIAGFAKRCATSCQSTSCIFPAFIMHLALPTIQWPKQRWQAQAGLASQSAKPAPAARQDGWRWPFVREIFYIYIYIYINFIYIYLYILHLKYFIPVFVFYTSTCDKAGPQAKGEKAQEGCFQTVQILVTQRRHPSNQAPLHSQH